MLADKLSNLLALEIKFVILLLKFNICSGKFVTEHVEVVLDCFARLALFQDHGTALTTFNSFCFPAVLQLLNS